MRPPKKILIYCADAEMAADRAFVMRVGVKFRPLVVAQPFEAEWEIGRAKPDAVLVLPTKGAAAWDREVIQIAGWVNVPVVVVSQDWAQSDGLGELRGTLCGASMAEILNGLRLATLLRRGPKPVRKVPMLAAVAESRAA